MRLFGKSLKRFYPQDAAHECLTLTAFISLYLILICFCKSNIFFSQKIFYPVNVHTYTHV